MPRNLVIAAVVILALIVGVWFLTRSDKTEVPQSETSTSESQSSASEAAIPMQEVKISITAGGFSPKAITLRIGQSVTFENMDSANHTVNSDPHPIHNLYPFLNAEVIKSGESKTIIFEKAGKYTYHDHLNPSLTGSVTVE